MTCREVRDFAVSLAKSENLFAEKYIPDYELVCSWLEEIARAWNMAMEIFSKVVADIKTAIKEAAPEEGKDDPFPDFSPCVFLEPRRIDLLPFYTSGFQ